MKFIKQEIISYTSPNISQEYATWSASTTYGLGGTNIAMYGNYFWISSVAGNLNHIPSEESPYWVKWGVSNYYSLIDTQSTTETVVSTNLVCTFSASNIDTLAIGYYTCQTLKIETLSGAGAVIDTQTITQSFNENVFDYYDYIYSDYTVSTDRAKYFDIFRGATNIKVSFLKGTFSQVKCGFLVGGTAINMGATMDEVKIGWSSYSTRTTDIFGIMTIVKRAAQDLIDFQTVISSIELMNLRRIAKAYRDETVAFVIDPQTNSIYENIVTLGVIGDMTPIASVNDKTVLTWSITEMI